MRSVLTRPKSGFFLLVFFLLFLLRISFLKSPEYPTGQEVRVVGRVTREPYLNESNQIIYLNEIKIFTGQFPLVSYGQQIEATGRLEKRLIKNKKGQFVLFYPHILILDHGEGAPFWVKARRRLIDFRHYLEAKIWLSLPEPQSSLLTGILLGTRTTMSGEFLQDLQRTGTLHIIAASGYNISVVAGVLISGLVLIFSRKKALVLAFLGIIAYTLMAGAGPAVLRAAIMGSLTYLAQFLGREREAVSALLFSAALMLLVSPLIYLDVGFQLSFAATGGILFLLPLLEKYCFFRSNPLGKEIGLTLAAQVGVLPIVFHHFQAASFLSPLANVLIAPLIPYVMGLGAATAFSGLIFLPLAKIVALPVWVLLTAMVKVISWFGKMSWSNLEISSFPIWAVVAYYTAASLLIVISRRRSDVS